MQLQHCKINTLKSGPETVFSSSFFHFLSKNILKYIKQIFILTIAEFRLIAGDGNVSEGLSSGPNVTDYVPRTSNVGRFWGETR